MTGEETTRTGGRTKAEASTQASHLADTVLDTVARQGDDLRSHLADRVEDLATSLRRAGSDGRPDSQTAGLFDRAADTVSELANSLETGDPRAMMDNVRAFARRQPGAFLGMTALAGFAAARFLTAGGPPASPAQSTPAGSAETPVSPPFGSRDPAANPVDGGSHA